VYGRIVPARVMNTTAMVLKEPVGVVAVYTVELPDQSGGAQSVRRARHRLLDHRESAGRNARVAR
jgi:hypothetical protein